MPRTERTERGLSLFYAQNGKNGRRGLSLFYAQNGKIGRGLSLFYAQNGRLWERIKSVLCPEQEE